MACYLRSENPAKRVKIDYEMEARRVTELFTKYQRKISNDPSENPAKRVKIVYETETSDTEFFVDVLDHVICNPGQMVGSYKIEETIGEGGFGRVLLATDIITGTNVALKMINSNDEARRTTGMTEIAALRSISCVDPDDQSLCIKMLDYFVNDTYIGIVFPLMGLSVFDCLKRSSQEGFPIDEVQDIAHQLCKAVDFLHRNGMTHTDIKPENIMFVNSDYTTVYDDESECDIKRLNRTDIRLIDFGCLTRDTDEHSLVISTRYYRAPEVLLELEWSHPCDVWSIGCTLIEIYYGFPLFDAQEDRHHLAIMEKTLGPIPSAISSASKTKHFKDGKLDWIWKGWEGREKELAEHHMPLNGYKLHDSDDHKMLFQLLRKMLEYEPDKRISASAALQHPFFDELSD